MRAPFVTRERGPILPWTLAASVCPTLRKGQANDRSQVRAWHDRTKRGAGSGVCIWNAAPLTKMPFLGPIIAAWITLAVVVLATYFLVVARDGERSREQKEVAWRATTPRTNPARPQYAARREPSSPPPSRSLIPRYAAVKGYDVAKPAKAWERPASGGQVSS